MARDAGAKKVYFASAAPPVRFPNVYGIDMPSRQELLAHDKSDEEILTEIGADKLIYQDLEDLKYSVTKENPKLKNFDCSCFDGNYATEDVSEAYLNKIETLRSDTSMSDKPKNSTTQLDLNLINFIAEEEEHA